MRGFTLLELLIALAVGSVAFASLLTLMLTAYDFSQQRQPLWAQQRAFEHAAALLYGDINASNQLARPAVWDEQSLLVWRSHPHGSVIQIRWSVDNARLIRSVDGSPGWPVAAVDAWVRSGQGVRLVAGDQQRQVRMP